MTYFGKWMGIHNGQEMLRNILMTDCTLDQAACAVTTYCLLFDVEVDTLQWDELVADIWEHYNCWCDHMIDLDNELSKFLI